MDNIIYNVYMRFHSPEKIERWKRWNEKAKYMPIQQIADGEINPRTGRPYKKQGVYKALRNLQLLIDKGITTP